MIKKGGKVSQLLVTRGKKPKRRQISFYVTVDNYKELKRICEARGVAISSIVDGLIADFLADVEKPDNN